MDDKSKLWEAFHLPRVNNQIYEQKFAAKYETFFTLIRHTLLLEAIGYPKVIEYGSGIGTVAKILYPQVPDIRLTLVEKNKFVTDLAKQNLGKLRREVRLESIDVLGVGFYNHCMSVNMGSVMYGKRPQTQPAGFCLAYSHGLLEHYNDYSIHRMVTCQLSHADIVINYVPSYKYDKPSFGDERLLKPSEWYDMFKRDSNKPTIIEFNDGYDLILVWKRRF